MTNFSFKVLAATIVSAMAIGVSAVTGKRDEASRRKAAICIIHLDNASHKGWNCWSKRCV